MNAQLLVLAVGLLAAPAAKDDATKEKIGKGLAHLVRAGAAAGAIPPRDPVDGPEDRERRHLRVDAAEDLLADPFLDDIPQALLEPVARRDDGRPPLRVEGVELEG